MGSLFDIQEDIKIKMSKAHMNFKKSPKDRLSVAYIETRLGNLERQWELFYNTHVKILSEINKLTLQESSYHKECIYEDVEDLYIQFKTEMKEMLSKIKSTESKYVTPAGSPFSKEGSNVKLPEIKIPLFSGKYIEWQTFRDLFLGLVHNNKSLDDAQRFYYLKGHLIGEAAQLLRNVNVTSENYRCSWERLESLYNNKRFLANGILKRLLNQKSLVAESAYEIKNLVNTTSDCLESIKNLGVDISSWDILIIHIVSAKLDKETRKAWELKISAEVSDKLPSYIQFTDFLVGRFRGLENLDSKSNTERNSTKSAQSFHVTKNKKEDLCVFCSESHRIAFCKKFMKESTNVRRNFALENGLCFICLNGNHSAKYCRNTFIKCHICKRRHHTLLHPEGCPESFDETTVASHVETLEPETYKEVSSEESSNANAAVRAEGSNRQVVSYLSTGTCNKTVLLTTALVKAESKDGSYCVVRALLDQGSQGSFVTEDMVQYLGLRKLYSRHTVTGVGGNKNILSRATVNLRLQSRMDSKFYLNITAYVLSSITSLLPTVKATKNEWIDLGEDILADPEYYIPNKINILLGAEVYSRVIKMGIRKFGSVVAQNTMFGWILSGATQVDTSSGSKENCTNITVMHCNIDSDELLRRFWELEAEPQTAQRIMNEEEEKCERFFADTIQRDDKGRYIVRLPFRSNDRSCLEGDSRSIAEKRLRCLEWKLKKNSKLREDYSKVIQEYLDLNHMVKVPEKSKGNGLYLPHHAVVKENRETTKVRVVFDASCKGKNGVSLNDNLMIGPRLQTDLRHLIIRWRKHCICLAADIVKMYRQVLVNREDTKYQRVLWRDDPGEEIQEFELITVTFGTSSAPYLAVRTLQQVAYDEAVDCPTLQRIILEDFYMDDLMTGADSAEEAYDICIKLKEMLAKGGFELQKWKTNSQELIQKMGRECKDEGLNIKLDNVTKILGLTWDPRADVFQYSVDLPASTTTVSKRTIISDISKLYDPLGWLAPSIILAKILIQKLWLSGMSWDQEVPQNLVDEWFTYRNDLYLLANVKVPRWMKIKTTDKKIELHGFADASKMAYAAVVYLRIIDSMGKIHVALVASKTKVAPIKQVSIPRLELCAAVLLAKLMLEVSTVMSIPETDLYAWTDSEIVLAWLNSHPSRWKTFVANRVSQILITLDAKHWSHVLSKKNPADYASRGLLPRELIQNSIWFHGPEVLKQTVIEYKKPHYFSTNLEETKVLTCSIDSSFTLWNKFSSLYKLVRVVAYCRRFLNKRNKDANNITHTTYLTTMEIQNALNTCIKRSQENDFAHVLRDLRIKGNINEKKNRFQCLNLFLDSYEIIRVGGRLNNSQLHYNRKHPILLSKGSFLTKMLIADSHAKTLHGGPQAMIAYLRTKYWIPGVKPAVRAYFRKCITCIRYSRKQQSQLMGQLPFSRVTQNKPFLYTGVDYAGPISIRVSKGRGNKSYKGYIALFICMSTRAIHLEAVSDMTSKGFLAAFRRFVARRGRCAELYSDNGTNFTGAARELGDLLNEHKSNFITELADCLSSEGTQWNFIPPHAPNFGGLWEAGVKSTKHHLRRVVGNCTLTFEEMTTVLAQIEACLNSRPLSFIEDSDDRTILTPGHFLVGEALVLVPDHNFEKSNVTSLRRWQLSQKMLQDFWRRWSQDYLNQFLQRRKWSFQKPEPNIGTVVLVKEADLPPGKWLLGKIEYKHPGPDGITRVVTVRCKNCLIKRPTSKICVLPITE